jgi:hypothetical protein
VSPGVLKIKKIPWLDRQRLRHRSRVLSRDLTGRLAAWNRELWAPESILETLGLAETDLRLLKDLSGRFQGWQPFEFDAQEGAEAARLAALGLVCVGRWRRIRLTGAGRVLLLFTSIDPKTKKARPSMKADSDMEGEADEPLS